MKTQILHFETPLEKALHKACRDLTTAHDYHLCDDDMYFSIIAQLDCAIERQRRLGQ